MGKFKILSGRDACKILVENDFVIIRQRGSHIVLQQKTQSSTVTVVIPNHKEIRIGTLQSIIRQSGLSRTLFEE